MAHPTNLNHLSSPIAHTGKTTKQPLHKNPHEIDQLRNLQSLTFLGFVGRASVLFKMGQSIV